MQKSPFLQKIETINFPSIYGNFKLTLYLTNYPHQQMKYAIVIQTKRLPPVPLIRIHSSCLFGEVLGYQGCDCQQQLANSLQIINKSQGILFYLDQEGRGFGLIGKTIEIKYQQKGLDTFDASKKLFNHFDIRSFDVVADILEIMKIDKVKIITNNPRKIKDLEKAKIKVVDRVSLPVKLNRFNQKYLKTKKEKMGHWLDL